MKGTNKEDNTVDRPTKRKSLFANSNDTVEHSRGTKTDAVFNGGMLVRAVSAPMDVTSAPLPPTVDRALSTGTTGTDEASKLKHDTSELVSYCTPTRWPARFYAFDSFLCSLFPIRFFTRCS